MIWLSASLFSKCTLFTVNLCYLQVLAIYKKVLYWWFSFDLCCLILGNTLFGDKNFYALCGVVAKKSCNNIKNSRAQVSRLCYFLWLWLHYFHLAHFPCCTLFVFGFFPWRTFLVQHFALFSRCTLFIVFSFYVTL